MIIKIDNSLIKHIKNSDLYDDPKVIKSINSFLRISEDRKHLVLMDILLIDFIKEKFEGKIDSSCFEALNQIRNKEAGGVKVILKAFPIYINVSANEEIGINEIKVSSNIYYAQGKTFEVNFYSLCDYSFLGEKVSILSEYDTDVELYALIGRKYLIENYDGLKFENNKINPGYGGNIKKAISIAARNNEKTLIICDTDKLTLDEPLKSGCTLESVESEFEKIKDNNIVHLVSLNAHEKENLIPFSWLQEFHNRRRYCRNALNLENSVFNDRLLFLDFKKGLTKNEFNTKDHVKEYYQPAVEHLNIDLTSLNDADYIFKAIPLQKWDENALRILESKKLSDYPDYLKENINKLGLFVSCWIISGRNDVSQAKEYVYM